MDADRLMALVAQYWELAYAEGAEGRTHDTEDGAAQRTLSEIRAAAQALAVPEGMPAAVVRIHKTGGNVGIRWSADPLDTAPLMHDGEILYTAAVPQEPRDA